MAFSFAPLACPFVSFKHRICDWFRAAETYWHLMHAGVFGR
jgi:hypothetical protein